LKEETIRIITKASHEHEDKSPETVLQSVRIFFWLSEHSHVLDVSYHVMESDLFGIQQTQDPEMSLP
jgi:hypothetical protein